MNWAREACSSILCNNSLAQATKEYQYFNTEPKAPLAPPLDSWKYESSSLNHCKQQLYVKQIQLQIKKSVEKLVEK